MVPTLVLAAWALLLAAWVVGNPPFAAPDETDHYVRTLGISQGQLIGAPDPKARIGVDLRQIAWTRQATRLVKIAGPLNPLPFTCAIGADAAPAACLNVAAPDRMSVILPTAVGNYPPLPYVLPAAVITAARSAPSALRLARATSALVVLALLALAFRALYDPKAPALSTLGLLLAVTPMVLFCGSILNGSGLEIASAIAFAACLLRVLRQPAQRGWLMAAGFSGAVLALSRPASLLWLAIGLAVIGLWAGRHRFSRSVAGIHGWWLVTAILFGAIVLNQIWEGLYGTHVPLDTDQLHAGLVAGVHQWWRALPELVGKFGYINVKLPLPLILLWFAALVGVLAAAMRGSRRDRVSLAAIVAAAVALPPVFYALFTRPTGFGLQSRQLLPAVAILPLLAGEIVYMGRARLSRPAANWLAWLVPGVVAMVQVGAWYANAKRFAVGVSGPVWFLPSSSWSPPLGWTFWLAMVLFAGCCLVGVAAFGRASCTTSAAQGDGNDVLGNPSHAYEIRDVAVNCLS